MIFMSLIFGTDGKYEVPLKHTLIAQTSFVPLSTKLNVFKSKGKIYTVAQISKLEKHYKKKDLCCWSQICSPTFNLSYI